MNLANPIEIDPREKAPPIEVTEEDALSLINYLREAIEKGEIAFVGHLHDNLDLFIDVMAKEKGLNIKTHDYLVWPDDKQIIVLDTGKGERETLFEYDGNISNWRNLKIDPATVQNALTKYFAFRAK